LPREENHLSDIVQKLWGFCHVLRHDGGADGIAESGIAESGIAERGTTEHERVAVPGIVRLRVCDRRRCGRRDDDHARRRRRRQRIGRGRTRLLLREVDLRFELGHARLQRLHLRRLRGGTGRFAFLLLRRRLRDAPRVRVLRRLDVADVDAARRVGPREDVGPGGRCERSGERGDGESANASHPAILGLRTRLG